MKITVTRVYHQSYAVKCECGYERFTTGSRARVSARNIAANHRTEHAAQVVAA